MHLSRTSSSPARTTRLTWRHATPATTRHVRSRPVWAFRACTSHSTPVRRGSSPRTRVGPREAARVSSVMRTRVARPWSGRSVRCPGTTRTGSLPMGIPPWPSGRGRARTGSSRGRTARVSTTRTSPRTSARRARRRPSRASRQSPCRARTTCKRLPPATRPHGCRRSSFRSNHRRLSLTRSRFGRTTLPRVRSLALCTCAGRTSAGRSSARTRRPRRCR